MILEFPEVRAGQPVPDDADRPSQTDCSEVIVFPRLSIRALRRLWGVPEEGLLEAAPDGRALLKPEFRDA